MNNLFNKPENNPQEFYYFQGGFNKEQLDKIYTDVAKIPAQEATTFSNTGDKSVRSSSIKWIPQNEEWAWLYEALMNYAEIANKELWGFDLIAAPELIQYTEYYDVEGGHYDWHQDIGPGIGSHRKVSITVQLSEADEYEGGDLQFWYGGQSITDAPKGAGVVVLFPSYLMHKVSKVTKGTRRSFVLWIGGEHYK
tara:strand:+ start:321 stop:905 length:585 start_codon:yes stop_codon:yes gene_type:complete